MIWRLALPVDKTNEPLTIRKAIDLAGYIDDHDDRATARETLLFLHEIGERAGGQLGLGDWSEILAGLDTTQRKSLIDRMRRRAGLESVEDVEAHERYQAAQRAALARAASGQPLRVVVLPSGALADASELEAEAARQRAQAASLAAQREAEQAQRDAEAAALRQAEAARDAALDAELPEHLRRRAA